jgi:hypothetical protein
MKATLEYNLPEERNEHLRAIHSAAAWNALYNIDSMLRNHLKYGSTFNTAEELATQIRHEINDVLKLLDE